MEVEAKCWHESMCWVKVSISSLFTKIIITMEAEDKNSFHNFMNIFHHEYNDQINVKLLIAFLRRKGDRFDTFDMPKDHLKVLPVFFFERL